MKSLFVVPAKAGIQGCKPAAVALAPRFATGNRHGGYSPVAALPTSTGICEYLPNANRYVYQQRALLVALQQWVASGTNPPASRYARISDGTLLPPANVGFPDMVFPTGIAAYPTVVFTGLYNTRNLTFWERKFDPDK